MERVEECESNPMLYSPSYFSYFPLLTYTAGHILCFLMINLYTPTKINITSICVQDVTAPKEAVWNQILDLNSYVGKVDRLKTCKNYYVKKNPDGTTTIKTKFITGVLPGYSYEFYCDHTYAPEKDSLIWSLDYEKTSDFNDVAGHWHLENHPNKDVRNFF